MTLTRSPPSHKRDHRKALLCCHKLMMTKAGAHGQIQAKDNSLIKHLNRRRHHPTKRNWNKPTKLDHFQQPKKGTYLPLKQWTSRTVDKPDHTHHQPALTPNLPNPTETSWPTGTRTPRLSFHGKWVSNNTTVSAISSTWMSQPLRLQTCHTKHGGKDGSPMHASPVARKTADTKSPR